MDYYSHNRQRLNRRNDHLHRSRNLSFSSALLAAICKSTEDEGGIMAYSKNGSRIETRNSRIQRQWNEYPLTDKEKFMGRKSAKMGVYNSEKHEAKAPYSKHREFMPADGHAKLKSKYKFPEDPVKPRKPTSPGRKLANFLNSLFMASDTKKRKLSSSSSVSESNPHDSSERKPASDYSSSSSVQSRPCLSKISGGSKNGGGMSKKSVTFHPSSVISDQDSRPTRNNCLYGVQKYPQITQCPVSANYLHIAHPSAGASELPLVSKELKQHIVEDDDHATARTNAIMEAMVIAGHVAPGEVEEDDDDSSCSSSDLFELENFAAIDMNMNVYQMELPVYETTHFVTNKAFEDQFIL